MVIKCLHPVSSTSTGRRFRGHRLYEQHLAHSQRDRGSSHGRAFVYTSGRHGNAYVNKDAIYPHTEKVTALCWYLAQAFDTDQVDVVVGPAMGGIILSQWTAHHLRSRTSIGVLAAYADKAPTGFVLNRGYGALVQGKRVLVVEDVLTTGESVRGAVFAVRAVGGDVVGVGALCNRGGVMARHVGEVPKLVSLLNITLDSWGELACPLCAKGVPVNTDVGKGHDFLARKATHS